MIISSLISLNLLIKESTIYNGLSDQDEQIIKMNNILLYYQFNGKYKVWKFDKGSIPDFIIRQRYEARGHLFGNYDVDVMFLFFVHAFK